MSMCSFRQILCFRATVPFTNFFIQFSKYLPELKQAKQETIVIAFNFGTIKIILGFWGRMTEMHIIL